MKKQIFRTILMIAGVLTVGIILLSQSVHLPESSKNTAHKAKQTERAHAAIQAPSDVVPSPSVHLDDVFPTLLKAIEPQPVEVEFDQPRTYVRIPFLSVLFRTLITPNAP